MLKILEKMKDGQTKFSAKELRMLQPYAPYFAKTGQSDVLKSILDTHSGFASSSLGYLFYVAAENGHAPTLRSLFSHSSEKNLSDAVHDRLDLAHDGATEVIQYAVMSGDIESFRILVDYYEEVGGPAYVKKALEDALFWFHDVPMYEEVLYTAQQYGGRDLVKAIANADNLTLDDAVWSSQFGKDRSDIAKAVIQKTFQYHDEEAILKIVAGTYNECCSYEEAISKGYTKTAAAMLQEVRDTCGLETARKVIEQEGLGHSLYFLRMATMYAADDILEVINGIARETGNNQLNNDIGEITSTQYGIASSNNFKDQISYYRQLIIKMNDQKEVDQFTANVCCEWADMRFHIPSATSRIKHDRDDFIGILKDFEKHPAEIRSTTMEEMVRYNDRESLEMFIGFVEETRGGQPVLELLKYFSTALECHASDVLEFIGEYALEHAGPHFMQDLLITANGSYPLLSAIAVDDVYTVKVLLKLAKESGEDFLSSIIAINDFSSLKNAESNDNSELIRLMLDSLSDEERVKAFEHVDSRWKNLAEGTIAKSQFWQEIGNGNIRWLEVTGSDAPDQKLRMKSPYRFKPNLYDRILPLVSLAAEIQTDQNSTLHAYKLSVLFTNFEEIDRYLTQYGKQWANEKTRSIIGEACDFDIPESGSWSPQKWKSLVLKYGPHASKYLVNAAKIEKYIGDKPFPENLKELRATVAEMRFGRAHEHPEFAKLASTHWTEKRLSTLANAYGVSQEAFAEKRFDYGLDVLQTHPKTSDQLPDIFIDGADIGHSNFYMMKLPAGDPLGLILGDITKDCQAILHNGNDCAVHGMTSEYGGFYVWKKKTAGIITEGDSIVAQSWAWVGKDHNIVFDTFERLHTTHAKLCQTFMEQFSHEVVGNHTLSNSVEASVVSAVRLGTDGYTPPLFIGHAENPSVPIDYEGKAFRWNDEGRNGRESHVQYEIQPINHIGEMKLELPAPNRPDHAEQEALSYIRGAVERIERDYGLIIKTGLEIECYAISEDGNSSSDIIDVQEVQKKLQHSGSDVRFEDENTTDHQGQYEVATKPLNPLMAIEAGNKARDDLKKYAEEFGIKEFDFSPVPFEDKEASSLHISLSLWSTDGAPIFADCEGSEATLLDITARGILEVQKYSSLLSAQTDDAYKRFGHSEWSPNGVACSDIGHGGGSVRIANATNNAYKVQNAAPEDVRIENRLPSSDSNIAVAMAGMIAGVEYTLLKYVKTFDAGTNVTFDDMEGSREFIEGPDKHLAVYEPEEDFIPQPLPKNRYHALQALKAGLQDGPLGVIAKSLFEAVLAQHENDGRKITPDAEPVVITLQENSRPNGLYLN